MRNSLFAISALTTLLALGAGCARQEQHPLDQAIDKTKDALDMRDHEQLRDAAESAKDAVHEAADGIKQEVKDANAHASPPEHANR